MKKIFFVSTIVLLTILNGCLDLPKELIMPEWDVDLNVPVLNKTYTLEDIIGEQSNLSIDPLSNLYIISSDTFNQQSNVVDFIKSNQEFTSDDNTLDPENGTKEAFIEFRTDNVELDSAVFMQGSIWLRVTNNSSVPVQFKAFAPGMTLNGIPLTLETSLLPHQTIVLDRSLENYKYAIPPEQLQLPPVFWKQFWIKSTSTAEGIPVHGEKVEFDIAISDFYFSSVSGKFPETYIGKKTTSFAFKKGDDIDSYRNHLILSEANLKLSTLYNSEFNNQFSLKIDSINIVGIRGNNRIYLKDSSGNSLLYLTIDEGMRTIEFTEKNSNLIEFLTFLPDSIILDGSYKILGSNMKGTVTNLDLIKFQTLFKTKSKLALRKTNLLDTLSITFSNDDRSDISKGKYAKLNVEVDNALPLNFSLKVVMLDSLYRPLFILTRDEYRDSVQFLSSGINVSTGETISSTKGKFYLDLNEQEIKLFSKAYFASVSVTFETEDANQNTPPLVFLRASDWINIKAYGLINYNVTID